jgi:tetratricopeptide (TPR) repeat protein
MRRTKTPEQIEKTKRSQLKLLLVGVGFFLIAGVSSLCYLFAEFWPQIEQMRSAQETAAQDDDDKKHDPNKEAKFLAEIETARKNHNNFKLVSTEYDYGDWLYNDRPADAQRVYREAADIAKADNKLADWYPALKNREGIAGHKLFLADGTKPDPAPLLAALEAKSAKSDRLRGSYLVNLGLIYADLGKYDEATKAVEEGIRLQRQHTPEYLAESMVNASEVAVRAGKPDKAAELFAQAYQLNPKEARSEGYELFDVAEGYEDKPIARAIRQKTDALIKANDYKGLDAYAAELRKSQAQYAGGAWHLDTFYNRFEIARSSPEDVFKKRFDWLAKWCEASPESITPRVILADTLIDFAWRARGSGWANSVSKEGWRKFGDRLEQAQSVIADAEKLKETCPRMSYCAQTVALGTSMDREDYDKLVASWLARYPNYNQIYLSQAYYLQPRWFGDEGEWERVASEQCNKVGGEAGDILYAHIAASLASLYDNTVKEAGVDYSRFKRGMTALRKKYPNSSEWALRQIQFASQAGDKELIAKVAKAPG